jgi:hypothetical protein
MDKDYIEEIENICIAFSVAPLAKKITDLSDHVCLYFFLKSVYYNLPASIASQNKIIQDILSGDYIAVCGRKPEEREYYLSTIGQTIRYRNASVDELDEIISERLSTHGLYMNREDNNRATDLARYFKDRLLEEGQN